MKDHAGYMARAIDLAKEAAARGEIPVGAVVVDKSGAVIGVGHNLSIQTCDPTAHAEIVALRCAASRVGNYRLDGCSLYVTLEPCPMCLGAVFHARIQSLYFGAWDPKGGACGSIVQLDQQHQLNPHCVVHGGVLQDECSTLLSRYFQQLRQMRRTSRTRLREDALRLSGSDFPRLTNYGHARVFDDLEASQGLRVHAWSSHDPSNDSSIDQLVLCIPDIAHWAWQFEQLLKSPPPPGVQVWIIDLPGQGCSDKTKTGWEFDEAYRISIVNELINRSGAKSVSLVAQGGSAMLAMKMARDANSKVHRVSLVDPLTGPSVALHGSSGRLPKSVRQIGERLAESALCGATARDMLLAPYPDTGHLRGLLRWLKQAEAMNDRAVGAKHMETVTTCPVTVFSHASFCEVGVLEFLRLWTISGVPVPWSNVIGHPWSFVLAIATS